MATEKPDNYMITVKKTLLDPKHIKAMRVSNKTTSLWLYLWLLDKVTTIDEKTKLGAVLGGKQLTIEYIGKDLEIGTKTTRRMLHNLVDNGYVKLIRSKYGNRIFLTKAEKYFGVKVNMVGFKKSAMSESQNLGGQGSKSGRPYIDNTERQYKEDNELKTNQNEFTKIRQYYMQCFKVKRCDATEARQKKFKLRSKDAGVEMIRQAISNASQDSFWKNVANIDYILRSYENVERIANIVPRKEQERESIDDRFEKIVGKR